MSDSNDTRPLRERLALHPFVAGLPDPFVERLLGLATEQAYPSGAFVLREGEAADTLYLLTAGRVVLEVAGPGRPLERVETLCAGELLGLHWLFPPRRWVLDARVIEPVRLIALDAERLRAELDRDPAFGYAVTTRLLAQLYERLERVRLQRLDVFKVDP